MRVVFRADASVRQGSGHVMRCLTLAEELSRRGHEVELLGSIAGIPWLDAHLAAIGIPLHRAEADELDSSALLALDPDWVVVDSYDIPAEAVSELAAFVALLAIVDGETRGIRAQLYLEQNLGSEDLAWPDTTGRLLAGAPYALIRDEILQQRRLNPAVLQNPPQVVAFMGGTDPSGTIIRVARELALVEQPFLFTVVAPGRYHDQLASIAGLRDARIIQPTPDLPALLGSADVIVSAAGTSAWDVCALGIPALFVGVVNNQSASLAELVRRQYALGVDLAAGGPVREIGPALSALLCDSTLRQRLSDNCRNTFDGRGAERVADEMERARSG